MHSRDAPVIIGIFGCAGVAQLVEQLICNQQVGGSSPSTSSTTSIEYGRIPERPKGADCKSVVTDFGGSNPPSPTKCYGLKRSTPENPCTARVFAVFRAIFCSKFSVIHLINLVDSNHRSDRFRAEIERISS